MDKIGTNEPAPDWDKLRPVLDTAMDRLEEREREVILLRFFAGRPFRDIGAALKISDDAARMRVDRALQKLRISLGRSGVTSTASALALVLAQQATSAAPAGLVHTITMSAASAAPSSLTGNLFLMITTHKAVALASVAAFVALGTVSREVYVAHAAEAAAIDAQEDLTREVQHLQAARGRQAAMEMELARLHAATPQAAGAADQRPQVDVPQPAARGAGGAPGTDTEDPAVAAMWAVERTKAQMHFTAEWRRIAGRALPFLRRVGLSPAQVDAYAALADAELDGERFRAWGHDPELTVETYPARLEKEWAEKTRALIGDTSFEELESLVAAQTRVVTLANYVARLEMPLSQPQSIRMLDLLSSAAARSPEGQFNWPYVYAHSEEILTPGQLSAWKRYRELDQFQRELNDEYRKAELARAAAGQRG